MKFSVLFVCICVLNNCHLVATLLQLNISYHMIRSVIICDVYHVLLGKEFENYETRRNVAGSEDKLEMYAKIFSGILNGRTHLEDLDTDRRTNLHYVK